MSAATPPVLLISTDFDGTLVEHGNPAPFSPLLVEILTVLRGRGVRWVINTGRSIPWLDDGIKVFNLPVHPDYAITMEREVFRPASDGRGWEDFGDWNAVCARRHRELFDAAGPLLAELSAFVERETDAELRYGRHVANAPPDGQNLVGIVSRTNEEMDRIVARLDAIKGSVDKFSYQRNSIYLSLCHADYDKGTALAELGRLIGVGPEGTFAVGDHQNDLPMLNGVHARHVACPANAIEEVKRTVREAGGYVTRDGYSAGVIEALRFYCADLDV